MRIVGILQGADDTDGAFCPKKMAAHGIDVVQLSEALSKALSPFAALLKDGHGVGISIDGDKASAIGFSTRS